MTEDFDPATVPINPAATVMLVDDRPDLHVLMMRRNSKTIFAGGMWVFPGGRVDAADGSSGLLAQCDDDAARRADERLGVDVDGLAYWAAVARETFEEAGMLLATSDGRQIVDVTEPRWIERRRALNAGSLSFEDLVSAERLALDTASIHYVAHWVTPMGSPRRFSARFFLARTPPGQDATQDDSETVRAEWVRPHDAIAAFERGEWMMMTPTVRMLESLGKFAQADEALAAAAFGLSGQPVRVVPRPETPDRYRIVLPGETGYENGDPDVETGIVHLRPL